MFNKFIKLCLTLEINGFINKQQINFFQILTTLAAKRNTYSFIMVLRP